MAGKRFRVIAIIQLEPTLGVQRQIKHQNAALASFDWRVLYLEAPHPKSLDSRTVNRSDYVIFQTCMSRPRAEIYLGKARKNTRNYR